MPPTDLVLLHALHDEHGAALWSFCLRLTGNDRFQAEDLVQETLLRTWRHPEMMEASQGSVRGWLFTVARNIFIDQWRQRRRHPEVLTDRLPERAEGDDTDQLLMSWMVAEAVRSLSEEHRAVLLHCYYQGRSVADAALRLGIPEGTVKSRTHYALRALRLALQEMGVVT